MNRVARIHASSGTTGQPTVVGYTKEDLDRWAHLVARSMYVGRRTPRHEGARRPTAMASSPAASARTTARRLGGYTVIPMSGGQTEKQVQLIHRLPARHPDDDPELHARRGRRVPPPGARSAKELAVKIGLFGAEPWTEGMRREIEESLDLKAVDIYGLSEVMGPGCGQRVRLAPGRADHLGRSLPARRSSTR